MSLLLLCGPTVRGAENLSGPGAVQSNDVIGRPVKSLLCLPQVDLTILVLDVNDNAPVFQRKDYAVTVPEDVAVGTEVLRVLATSADIGPNAEITYHIRLGNELGKFTIDRSLGEQRSVYCPLFWIQSYKHYIVPHVCFRLYFCG